LSMSRPTSSLGLPADRNSINRAMNSFNWRQRDESSSPYQA
jgi:hypothetical protein